MSSQTLFPPSLLSIDSIPGYTIRPLHRDDYNKGFYDCLSVLTWVGEPTEADFVSRFDEMLAAKETYFFVVVEFEGGIVGTGCLVVERKFIHGHGKCGHVEEIAVQKSHQGKGLGLRIMKALESVARAVGCYKCILNCGPKNAPFYEKCGYFDSGMEMSNYLEEGERDAYHRG